MNFAFSSRKDLATRFADQIPVEKLHLFLMEGNAVGITSFSEFLPTISIQYSLLNDPVPAVFAKDSEKYREFLAECCRSVETEENSINVRLRLLSIFDSMNQKIAEELAVSEMQNPTDPILSAVRDIIDPQNQCMQVTQMTLFNLIMLRDSHPGMFYTLIEKWEALITEMGISEAIKVLGPEVFCFMKTPPKDFFENWITDVKLASSLFIYSSVYSNVDVCDAFQRKIASLSQYPRPFLSEIDVSLVNTSILRNKHFCDIHFKEIENFLISGTFESLPPYVQKYPELLPYAFLAYQGVLYSDITNAERLLDIVEGDSRISDILQRMKNDLMLMQNISFMTDTVIVPNDLVRKSLPLLLQPALGNGKVFDWANLKMFLVTDAAMEVDFDFLRCYTAIWQFLRCFRKTGKIVAESMTVIKNLIDGIKNPAYRSYLIIDLFSCIFLTENDQYVCHPSVAQKMVKVLVEYNFSEYITGARMIFKTRKLQKSESQMLDGYFVTDHNLIYAAVVKRKWENANQMTTYLPYYRRYYVKSHIAYCLLNSLPVPSEIERDRNKVVIDVVLATAGSSFSALAYSLYPNYKDLIKNRENNDQAVIMKWCGNDRKWIDVEQAVKEMELDIYDIIASVNRKESYLTRIVVSKNVTRFINQVICYFQSYSLHCMSDDTDLPSMFNFHLTEALAGPFNIGDFTKSQQLASLYHVDLFEQIVKHEKTFNITEDYLAQNFRNRPLECAALAYSHGMKSIFAADCQGLSDRCLTYIRDNMEPHKAETNSDEKANTWKVLELVSQGNLEMIDDFIFNCDLYELYRRMLKMETAKYSDAMMYALEISSSAARTQEELNIEKRIRHMYKVKQITSAIAPTQIITDLMEGGMFDMALSYTKICLNHESGYGSAIFQLFSLCVENGEQIDILLKAFPERYDFLSSKFFHLPFVMQHLLKSCPEEKRKHTNALAKLPEEVTLDANIFDLSTVIASFGRHPNCIFQLTDETIILFTDAHLVQLLEYVSNHEKFNKIFVFIYPYINDKTVIARMWIDKVSEMVRKVDVRCREDEDRCIQMFDEIQPILELFASGTDKIKCIIEFVSYHPFLRYNMRYSFASFNDDDFGSILLDLCARIDLSDLAERVSVVFSADMNPYLVNRLELLLSQGMYTKAMDLFDGIRNPKMDETESASGCEIFRCLIPVIQMPIFDGAHIMSIIKNIEIGVKTEKPLGMLFIYQTIRVTKQFRQDKTRSDTLSFLISNGVSRKTAISMLVRSGAYGKAYELLMQIQDIPDRVSVFINDFYYPALTRDLKSLEMFLRRIDPDVVVTRSLWEGLLAFCNEREMTRAEMSILMYTNRLEEAANAALEIFDVERLSPKKLVLLGNAQYALSESLHARRNPSYRSSPPIILSSAQTVSTVEWRLSLVEFMQQAVRFCHSKGIKFMQEYNIVKRETNAINLGSIFIIYEEDKQFRALRKLIPVEIREVVAKACETLIHVPLDQLIKFMESWRKKDSQISSELNMVLLRSLVLTNNKACLASIIMKFFKDPKEQCRLFIEYDYLVEAFSTAVTGKLKHMFPLIAYRASIIGNKEIVDHCYNALM